LIVLPLLCDDNNGATLERELTLRCNTGLSLHEESPDRRRPEAEV